MLTDLKSSLILFDVTLMMIFFFLFLFKENNLKTMLSVIPTSRYIRKFLGDNKIISRISLKLPNYGMVCTAIIYFRLRLPRY